MFDRVHTVFAAVALALSSAALSAAAHGRDDRERHDGHDHGHRGSDHDHDGRGSDEQAKPVKLSALGTYDAGGAGSAEIVAYDARSRRLFVVNAQTATVDILDVRNPAAPVKLTTIDTSAFGSPNSVAVHDGIVAVAIESNPKTDPGRAAFYDTRGELIAGLRGLCQSP
jgi:hypothetical protein